MNPTDKIPPRRLLLVDDDQFIIDSLGGMFADRGYEVSSARNGQQALALLRDRAQARPDAIVLSLMMPVLSGLDFLEARAVDDDLRSIPVAILTAHSHEPLRLRNVIGVFRKSADLARMFEALDEHFATGAR